MPYSPKHKRESREKILESARRLFNNKGFSEVSIDEIMENAGLTRGGFYRHFRDKDELYAEAVRRFLCTDAPKPWQPKSSHQGWRASHGASASLMPISPGPLRRPRDVLPLDRSAIGCHARQRCSERSVSRGIGEADRHFPGRLGRAAAARARTCPCGSMCRRRRGAEVRRRSGLGRRFTPCRASAGVAHRRLEPPGAATQRVRCR